MHRRGLFLLVCCGLPFLLGCGGGKVVNGTVTLDGKPTEGATVIFTSDTGVVASGLTDASGNFTLAYNNSNRIPTGSYKITVTRTSITPGQAPGDPANKDNTKDYTKEMKDRMPKAGPPGQGGADGNFKQTQSSLPAVYAQTATTPLSTQVPVPNDSISIELKSKP